MALRWWAVAVMLAGCSTSPDVDRLPDGLYTADYEEPVLTRTTPGCDRLVSRVLLIINERGTFEMSINVIDDCTRGGEGFSYFSVDRNGGYFVDGSDLTFTPNGGPTFKGGIEEEYIRLVLPNSLDLSASDLTVRVAPRTDT